MNHVTMIFAWCRCASPAKSPKYDLQNMSLQGYSNQTYRMPMYMLLYLLFLARSGVKYKLTHVVAYLETPSVITFQGCLLYLALRVDCEACSTQAWHLPSTSKPNNFKAQWDFVNRCGTLCLLLAVGLLLFGKNTVCSFDPWILMPTYAIC